VAQPGDAHPLPDLELAGCGVTGGDDVADDLVAGNDTLPVNW
jgi:hypothetical protein